MEGSQPLRDMDQSLPDLALAELRPVFGVGLGHFQQVTPRGKFHHNAECRRSLIIKRILIPDNVLTVIRGQYSNLIQSVLSLFLFHGGKFNLSSNQLLLSSLHTFVHLVFFLL